MPTNTEPQETPAWQKFCLRLARASAFVLFGLGAYAYALELGTYLSLVPSEYKQSVETQITIVSYAAASGAWVPLMFFGTIGVVVLVFRKLTALDAAATHSEEHVALPKVDTCKVYGHRQCIMVHYCLSLVINDALVNRAQDSSLVSGGLFRMATTFIEATSVYIRQLCMFAFVFLIASIFALRKAHAAMRRAREEQGDVERSAATGGDDVPAADEKSGINQKEAILVDVTEQEVIFDADETEKVPEKN